MSVKIGYLLPTRENIMASRTQGRLLLDAAKPAQGPGFDSVWAGDSLLARPRHDPLALLAAGAQHIIFRLLGAHPRMLKQLSPYRDQI